MIPNYFKTWNNIWDNYHDWLLDVGLSPLEACLAFATSQNEISKVIVGVNNLSQVEEILNLRYRKAYNLPDKLFSVDKNLLNPSLWRLK